MVGAQPVTMGATTVTGPEETQALSRTHSSWQPHIISVPISFYPRPSGLLPISWMAHPASGPLHVHSFCLNACPLPFGPVVQSCLSSPQAGSSHLAVYNNKPRLNN